MYMDPIGARQIKAARALLDWSQDDLAAATSLSIATIRKLEMGAISPRASTASVLRKSLEDAGIEFTDAEGVRRRQEEIRIYQGAQGCAGFLDDIASTARNDGGDLLAVAPSALALAYLLCTHTSQRLEDLIEHNSVFGAKIILTDSYDLPCPSPRLEYRSISTNYVDPMPFCVYGDKYALVAASEGKINKVVVIQSAIAARSSRKHFHSMWEKALCSAVVADTSRAQAPIRSGAR